MSSGIKTFDRLPRPMHGPVARPPMPKVARDRPLVGVIRNVRSHRNSGREQGAVPDAEILLETPQKRRELSDALRRLARKGIDYLAISGGDGTVRDVLTNGAEIFGDDWPPLIVLPKGKTNALAGDLGAPADWRLVDAMAAARSGRMVERCPIIVTEAEDALATVWGFMLGAGVFHKTIALGQDAHRFGAFNAMAVGVATVWSLAQAFFAGSANSWRQRSLMRLTDGDGQSLPGPDQRYFMIASTLENFALGLKPFGALREGLKLAALDTPSRRSLLWIPLVAIGKQPRPPERRGYHWDSLERFGMTLDGPFILDGEAFPPGDYHVTQGRPLRFIVP